MFCYLFLIVLYYDLALAQMWPPILPINYARRRPLPQNYPPAFGGMPFAPQMMPMPGQMPQGPGFYGGRGGVGMFGGGMSGGGMPINAINGLPPGMGGNGYSPFSMDNTPFSQTSIGNFCQDKSHR